MRIACKCAECGNIFMNAEDDLCMEFDFMESKITYMCRNSSCKKLNTMDLKTWKDDQGKSPLPRIGLV